MRRILATTAILLAASLIATFANSGAQAGNAAPFTVTRFDDPAPGECLPLSCSIRQAVLAANDAPGPDTVIIPPGNYSLTRAGADNTGQLGDLDVLGELTITGAGMGATTINNQTGDNAIHVPIGVSAHIEGLTISGGVGGIYNFGDMTLDRVEIKNSHNTDDGGAIDTFVGTLTIMNSYIHDNESDNSGGGIEADTVTVLNSTISHNTAPVGGAGVSAAQLTMVNSTVVNNHSTDFYGGGVWIQGFFDHDSTSTITNSTITDNVASDPGGGVRVETKADLVMANTILRDNTAPGGADCSGAITARNNLVESSGGCTLTGNGNMTGDPELAPLGNYGGPTMTRAIPKTSIAKDTGSAADCPATDQRGVDRPHGAGCDIGAYEFDYVGDVNCSGTVETGDISSLLGAIGGVASPQCIFRGNIDCTGDITGVDVLFIVRHLAALQEQPRPPFCPDIGPDPAG